MTHKSDSGKWSKKVTCGYCKNEVTIHETDLHICDRVQMGFVCPNCHEENDADMNVRGDIRAKIPAEV